MTTKKEYIRHTFGGGWATDFGPTADVAPRNGAVSIPFLIDADNIIYELDGGTHKVPGSVKLNSTVLESGAVIKGLFDYWISGTGGSSTQKRIVHVGTKIKKDDADGSFSDIKTGLESGKVPSYAVLEDLLVMATDSTTDVPQSWDGSTEQDLAGSPPNFSFCEEHKNRMWASGNAAKPSRLYYSTLLDAADWTGAGSGFLDISPSDGDRVTGIRSHKDELWIFKGPYKGSIHRVAGSAPTGGDPFRRKTFVQGVGAVGHNTIFTFRDDLGFMWSDGTVHSLKTTASFGDFDEASLSRPILNYIRDHVNKSQLNHAWAADWSDMGIVIFAIPVDSSTNNNLILMMDYRFDPVRWANWPAYAGGALATVVDATANNKRLVYMGGNDGFVSKLGQSDRSILATTAIASTVTAPFLNYGAPILMKTPSVVSIGMAPKNNGNVIFGWQRDDEAQQTQNISQGGGAVLGTATTNQFTLGTSTLAGSRHVERFAELEEGGEFRAIQLQWKNSTTNEDVEIHSISLAIEGGGWSTEN